MVASAVPWATRKQLHTCNICNTEYRFYCISFVLCVVIGDTPDCLSLCENWEACSSMRVAVQTMIDDAIYAAKREQLVALSSDCQLSLEDLDGAVQPIIDSCTKEAISVCTSDCYVNLNWGDFSALYLLCSFIIVIERLLLTEHKFYYHYYYYY